MSQPLRREGAGRVDAAEMLTPAVRESDTRLAAVSDQLEFLLQVTPANADEAWEAFSASEFQEPPRLAYRPLPYDPHLLKRALFNAPVESVEDPALEQLFREKQEELDIKITMLRDRGTERFLLGSRMIFGGVEPELVELAEKLLYRLPAATRSEPTEGRLDCAAFAALAGAEIEHYRGLDERFPGRVEIRDDLLAGMMVTGDCLLVSADVHVPRRRAEALIQHEVGVHLVSRFNGHCQPLALLASGLAGYDALQEGLAVTAEYLVDGLNRGRLRTLAGRVLVVDCLMKGADFTEAFAVLYDRYGFSPQAAFNIVSRVFRSGGFTKDAVYLRGLVELLGHLGTGGSLEPLLVGKIALVHLPLVEDLLARGVLHPPALVPRFLAGEANRERMAVLRRGLSPLDLVATSHD
jgi:uncharacterized protein (TIGR02421 family)